MATNPFIDIHFLKTTKLLHSSGKVLLKFPFHYLYCLTETMELPKETYNMLVKTVEPLID